MHPDTLETLGAIRRHELDREAALETLALAARRSDHDAQGSIAGALAARLAILPLRLLHGGLADLDRRVVGQLSNLSRPSRPQSRRSESR